MSHVSGIFSQILRMAPRAISEDAITNSPAERHSRGFRCWDQFHAMMLCKSGTPNRRAKSAAG
jgi:hypothetical protein